MSGSGPPDGPRRNGRIDLAQVLRATLRGVVVHDLDGEAAKMAFWLFLSLFPVVLVVFALTGIAGGDAAFGRIVHVAHGMVPPHAWPVVDALVRELTGRERPGVLSVGVLLTAWAASSGIVGLVQALNRMYELRDGRGWWRRRALALGVVTVVAALAVLAATALLPALGLLPGWRSMRAWNVTRWPLAFGLVATAVWLAYLVLPARGQRHALRETAIGAVVATTLWAVATAGFGWWVGRFGRYDATYGAVGAVIVLLLWLYLTSGCILVGAELAVVLEQGDRERRRWSGVVARGPRAPEPTFTGDPT
jgi:membrane protein